ncbi:MAG: biotin--[acetyl-CoA-carboxylase] ligase [Opitutaceae bacterium]|nr:biotin--[acetyl-CoA-carboxylase] ligase [Opitutaceae bacterium]
MNLSPETVILRALVAGENEFVSGSTLAEKLGMSRVAIWQHMEKLRGQGFEFEAVRARGYRLARRPTVPHPGLIRAYLPAKHPPFVLEYLTHIDSTIDEAARLLAAGRATPLVVIARRQTKGRGRFGRTWHSEANGNLYISFAFRPRLAPARMQTFTLWMGVHICDLIAAFTGTAPGIKWPNDILFDRRKAGGILTEARMDADHIRDIILGLGLNLNSDPAHWPEDLVRRATSIVEQAGAPVDTNKFTAALITRVLSAYEQFVAGPCPDIFAGLWRKYDLLRGRAVAVLNGEERIAGTVSGVDAEGSLILRDAAGKTLRFRAGEVTIEKEAAGNK